MKECETAISEELSWPEMPTPQNQIHYENEDLFDRVRCGLEHPHGWLQK